MNDLELRAEDPGLADLPARFVLVARLGRGGMANVYLARDTATESEVALKVLYPHLRDDALVVARFRREIAAARRIQHENIIRIHDLIETPRLECLVLEYLPGSDLKSIIRRRDKLPVDEALTIARQLLAGLAVAHRAGVVHRDIKPNNILVDEAGLTKIADFGIARVDDLIGITAHTMTLGTPEYMAPELLGSSTVDGRADLYGVGVVLYELLTGWLPFRASTPMALMRMHLDEPPPNPCVLVPELPSWLGEVVRRAMAKDPEDRYATADELREALQGDAIATIGRTPIAVADKAGRSCPNCAAPLLPGLGACVECGIERVFLSEQPAGGGWVIIDRLSWPQRMFGPDSDDFLTFADKARISATLTRLGGHVGGNEAKLDSRLRRPPIVLAQQLSAVDGEALALELRNQGIALARHVPRRELWWLVLVFGRVGRNLMVSALFGLIAASIVHEILLMPLLTVVLTAILCSLQFVMRSEPIARFDAGVVGVRQSQHTVIGKATQTFALIRSDRLRHLTRRILARGLQLHDQLVARNRVSDDALANLDQALLRSLDIAARIAMLEAAIDEIHLTDVRDRIERLELRSADAQDIHQLDEIAAEQHALRVVLSDFDEHHGDIARLSAQLLDTAACLAKLQLELDADRVPDIDNLTSVSVILGDLERELDARRELDPT